jgi:hypothetical protein
MVEIASGGAETDEKRDGDLERMMVFLDSISDHIIDGVVPQDVKQSEALWVIREEIANANIAMGYCLKYDVSLRTDNY